jgi:HD-GYP domain-containing protein (c-di-GMP phosphodiesterase class II)
VLAPSLSNLRGVLSTTEFQLIKQHPEESCRLMRKMGYDNPHLLHLVRHSHEHYSGSDGYPGQLTGEEIPLGSRIIAVVDAYDALTSWRPYREAWERHAAIGEIRREVSKGIYDPAVVDALDTLLN